MFVSLPSGCCSTCRSFRSFSSRSLSEVSVSSSCEADSPVFRSSASSDESSVICQDGHTRTLSVSPHDDVRTPQKQKINPLDDLIRVWSGALTFTGILMFPVSDWIPRILSACCCLPGSPDGRCWVSARFSLSPPSPASVWAAGSPPAGKRDVSNQAADGWINRLRRTRGKVSKSG